MPPTNEPAPENTAIEPGLIESDGLTLEVVGGFTSRDEEGSWHHYVIVDITSPEPDDENLQETVAGIVLGGRHHSGPGRSYAHEATARQIGGTWANGDEYCTRYLVEQSGGLDI